MKKKLKFLLFCLLLFVAPACRKEQPENVSRPILTNGNDSLSVEDVKKWFAVQTVNIEKTSQSTFQKFSLSQLEINWKEIVSVRLDTANYLVGDLPGDQPVFQNVKQGFRKIIFHHNKNGQIESLILEVIPDALYLQRAEKIEPSTFTGRVFVYDSSYQLKSGLIYLNGKNLGAIKPNSSPLKKSTDKLTIDYAQAIETCNWVDNNYVNSNGEVVIYSEKTCTYTIDDPNIPGSGTSAPVSTGHTGGGGGTSASAPEPSNLPMEGNPGIKSKDYMDCFGNLPDAGSKMTVTIYVQEPAPGLPFNVGPNSVGHTAIGLTKTYKGQSITQVVGFYPDATGKAKMHAPSKILDNSDLKYTTSITYSIIASEFNKIVKYIATPPDVYDITDFNCTNFAYNACLTGGIKLPDPNGNMGLGKTGMTPAALGSSLRDIAPNNNVNTNEGRIPPTKGPCK